MIELASQDAAEAFLAAHSGDYQRLSEAIEALATNAQPWAGILRLKAIHRRRLAATAGAADDPSQAAPVQVKRAASSFGLPAPDGRPLYRYKLSLGRFAEIEDHLKAAARNGALGRLDEALFVLWAAEWFRRHFRGGMQRWADLGDRLGLVLPQSAWRGIADRGLAVWKLKPLRVSGMTLRLLNIARQGGFPVAAIEDAGGGWARAYLSRLVGVLLAEQAIDDIDLAFRHAEALKRRLPDSWQYDDFYAVSADLALAIVRLRRMAETGGAAGGLLPSLWLDANCPDWRDELPLTIDSDAGRRLVDTLMQVQAVRGGTGIMRVVRMLLCVDGHWQEAARLELNGTLKCEAIGALSSEWNRLRLYACGGLARSVPGELAVLEPSETGDWVAVSSREPRAFHLPFNNSVDVEVRSLGERIGAPLRLASAITSELLVYQATDGVDDSNISRLELVGTGSGRYRADPLYVALPHDWTLNAANDESSVTELGNADGGRRLWRVSKEAVVVSDGGDRYLIRGGQTAEERDLVRLLGDAPPLVRQAGGLPLIVGRPTVLVRDRGHERAPPSGELFGRAKGSREWRPLSSFAGVGASEFAWRDPQTGLVRDLQSAVIFPADFAVSLEKRGDVAFLAVFGWPGGVDIDGGIAAGPGRWQFSLQSGGHSLATLSLSSPGASPLQVAVRIPHHAWIGTWTGAALPRDARICLADLHHFVARAEGRCELMAQLINRDGCRLPEGEIRWRFDDELPLNALRDDLAALLRPLGELDAKVELDFNDGLNNRWFVCEFDTTLERSSRGGYEPSRAIIDEDVCIAGRPLHAPTSEQDFGPIGLMIDANQRPIDLPVLTGNWLVYLRSRDRVHSRPRHIMGRELAILPSSALGRAMAFSDRDARQSALQVVCDSAEGNDVEAEQLRRDIINLVLSLGGLPPSTFDILALLPERPLLATRLLFDASDAEIPELLALSASLPFAWVLIPKRFWTQAAGDLFETLISKMQALNAPLEFAASVITARRKLLAQLEPATGILLDQPVDSTGIETAALAFIQRAHDRTETRFETPFRPQLQTWLPAWTYDQQWWRSLDAPCAAALVATEHIQLSDAQLRCIKDVARRHPRYFAEGYNAVFKDRSNG